MELFETTAYAHPADEVYEGQPAQIGEVEKNPHIHLTGTPLGILTTVLPVLIVLVLVYLVLIRPQRRADRTAKRLAESVKTGDEITTIGGICGRVIDADEKYVFIEIGNMNFKGDRPFLKVEREAVKSVRRAES